jgi:NADH dehydrogenase
VAQNIVASLYRRPLKAFSFKTIGLLASIGRRRGVARIFGFNFSGFFAWWLWRTIYLSKLPGLDKKVRVAFEWTLDLLFRKDVCAVHRSTRRGDRYQKEKPMIRNGEGHDTSAGNLIRENKTVGWGISSSRERSGSAAG